MATSPREDAGPAGRGLRGRARRSTSTRGVLEIRVGRPRLTPLDLLRREAERLDQAPCACQDRRAAMAAALLTLLEGLELLSARLREPVSPPRAAPASRA